MCRLESLLLLLLRLSRGSEVKSVMNELHQPPGSNYSLPPRNTLVLQSGTPNLELCSHSNLNTCQKGKQQCVGRKVGRLEYSHPTDEISALKTLKTCI